MRTKKYTSHSPAKFLKTTYDILNQDSMSCIISWTEDGESFIIKDILTFTSTVLPKAFKHRNLSSFIRQLNMYGFHKDNHGQDVLQFSHPLFHRNRIDSLKEIKRKKRKNLLDSKKEEVLSLSERLKTYQSKQQAINTILLELEREYSSILEQNQVIISKLFQKVEKEAQIELFLSSFTQKQKAELEGKSERPDLVNFEIEPAYNEEILSEESWEKNDIYDD